MFSFKEYLKCQTCPTCGFPILPKKLTLMEVCDLICPHCKTRITAKEVFLKGLSPERLLKK